MEQAELLEYLVNMLENLVRRYGSLGIAAAMFAESAGVPFAASIMILTAGSMILSGRVSFWSILIASVIGIMLGSMFSYGIGLAGNIMGLAVKNKFLSRFRRGQTVQAVQERSKVVLFWDRYGNSSIFMGQLWGVTRTFISYFAGAMHMNFFAFILYTFLGGVIFSLLAIGASIGLTGVLGYILKLLRTLAELSPMLLVAVIVMVLFLAYQYRQMGWRISLTPLKAPLNLHIRRLKSLVGRNKKI